MNKKGGISIAVTRSSGGNLGDSMKFRIRDEESGAGVDAQMTMEDFAFSITGQADRRATLEAVWGGGMWGWVIERADKSIPTVFNCGDREEWAKAQSEMHRPRGFRSRAHGFNNRQMCVLYYARYTPGPNVSDDAIRNGIALDVIRWATEEVSRPPDQYSTFLSALMGLPFDRHEVCIPDVDTLVRCFRILRDIPALGFLLHYAKGINAHWAKVYDDWAALEADAMLDLDGDLDAIAIPTRMAKRLRSVLG